jgi:IMP cyclohydrolase
MDEAKYVISRAINGISLNGMEYVLDDYVLDEYDTVRVFEGLDATLAYVGYGSIEDADEDGIYIVNVEDLDEELQAELCRDEKNGNCEYKEDAQEQQRRDEKNGLYPDREDVAN